jgi:hypothetical protein
MDFGEGPVVEGRFEAGSETFHALDVDNVHDEFGPFYCHIHWQRHVGQNIGRRIVTGIKSAASCSRADLVTQMLLYSCYCLSWGF